MDPHALKLLEIEMAMFVRNLTSLTQVKKYGNLDRSAYLLLHQISTHGAAFVKALADEAHLDISTVSRQVAALEQKGYVSRMSNPLDGRSYSFVLTDEGTKELLHAREARLNGLRTRLKDWHDTDIETLGELLRKFNETF